MSRIIVPGEPAKQPDWPPLNRDLLAREFARMFKQDSVFRQFDRVFKLRDSMPRERR